jgi:4-amino-4-deoxy-L-arabinose transferase-like glycosyltransferase
MRDVQPAASITQLNRRRTTFLIHLLVPLGFFAAIMLIGAWAKPFQYDPDEGLNLMKAALVSRGYRLYSQIWSDQPPLDTLVRAAAFAVTGPSTMAARVVTALFATLLIWAMLDLVARLHSMRAGLATVTMLAVSAWFARLSFAVMIGLPALALAVVSLNLLSRWATRGNVIALLASGALLAAGIATKLFAAVAMPAAVAMIWIVARQRGATRETRFATTLVWVVMTLLCCAAIFGIFRPPMEQVIEPHQAASQAHAWFGTPAAITVMRRDSDLLVLAIAAAVLVASGGTRNRSVLVPLVWLACGALAVQMHRPARYHHSLMLVIPAAWAGGIVVDALLDARVRSRAWTNGWARAPIMVFLLALLLWQCGKAMVATRRMFGESSRRDERRLVSAMESRRDMTRWVVADQQIYPFVAGLLSPPELAVTSTKRRRTGALSDEFVLDVLKRYRPEQVLLAARLDFGPAIEQFLAANYRLVGRYKIGAPQPARLYFIGKDPTPATTQPTKPRKKRRNPTTAPTSSTHPTDSPVQVN